MRAVDLLGATVYDVDGQAVGTVHDLHFEAGGRAVPGSGRPAYRLTALECGPVGLAHRLGYGHQKLAGPWPMPALLRQLARRSLLVNWSDIARINGSRIDLTVRRADLRALVEAQS
jgi:hypothetical protein